MSVRRLLLMSCLGALAVPGSALGGARVSVVGGRPIATPAYMGFVVQVADRTGGGLCGGFAIRPNVLVTAAHCVVDEQKNSLVTADRMHVVLGIADPLKALELGKATDDPVVQYTVAPGFGRYQNQATVNDVALLRLRDRVAGTVRLARGHGRLAATGTASVVIGWGRTAGGGHASTLRRADLAIQSTRYCGQLREFDSSRMLCAWSRTESPCHGDSGSPVLVSGPAGHVYAAGVVNFGAADCRLGIPFFAANLSSGPVSAFVARTASRLQRAADAAHG
jgi:secreted trypsin-like serine protease